MQLADPVHVAGWPATLELGFERRGGRTALASRRHDGPLVVQKALYPEGESVCHVIVVHPPAGIAGGDSLSLRATVGTDAHALLTTPGAAKWYRSAGPRAQVAVSFDVAARGCMEWLPQESIVFDGALGSLSTEVRLAADARYVGWEILCLGRTGSGERFLRGAVQLETRVLREDRLLWFERGRIDGGGTLLDSPAGLAGQPVAGTMIATLDVGTDLLSACRDAQPASGDGAVTRLPGLLIARYLGASTEAARAYFTAIWRVLRPALAGRAAETPRIWRT